MPAALSETAAAEDPPPPLSRAPARRITLPVRQRALLYAAYILLHVAFHASARFFEVSAGVSVWYPPVGLALALATMTGLGCAPVVLAANLYSGFAGAINPAAWTNWALPLLITTTYVGAGAVVRHWFGPVPKPTRPWAAAAMIGSYLTAPVLSAGLGSMLVISAGHVPAAQFPVLASSWWIGDLTGVLTVVPLCLVHLAPRLFRTTPTPSRRWNAREAWEIAAQGGSLVAVLAVVHGFGYIHPHQTYYLSFVPLVWICLRHGLPGATLAVFALTMGSLLSLRLSHAPAVIVTDLVLFEVALAAIGLGLGATVTRRARAESERSRLLALLEASPDFVSTADLNGRVLYQNAALRALHGDAAGELLPERALIDARPAWAADRLAREGIPTALAQGAWQGETAFLHRDGREIPVLELILTHPDAAGRPAMLSSVARDISSQKQAERTRLESERNLLQAQKLESLGVMAGGIAHDFNNLLTVVLGNATLARLELGAGSASEKAVHQIELAALRAAALCRQMLAYSGKHQLTTELLDVTRIVEETTHLLRVSISKKCTLEFDLARGLPPVQGDATQLSQVVMNLVINASDASEQQGGRIVVRAGVCEADAAYLATAYLAQSATPGRYVYLEVSDDGCGMTAEVQRRIFEPFFTTKFSGHGLGLSATLGIVRAHHGAIKMTSGEGRGTTFRVLLPAAAGTAAPRPAAPSEIDTWRGSGRVLVVDDEENVREVAAQILQHYGFDPVPASHGREAVELFRADPAGFALVLLDLSMPVMDGREAFEEIRRLDPTTPVLLMSGYNRTESPQAFRDDRLAGFIQKPFETADLGRAVREALAADAHAASV